MDAMSITRSIYMGVEKYLSDEELLFKQIGFNTIKHIVESADKVIYNISTNAYGEFAFVDVMFGDQTYTLWGLGYHHRRDDYILSFDIYSNPSAEWDIEMTSDDVMELLVKRMQEICNLKSSHHQCDEGALYSGLADIFGDDVSF